MELSRAGQEKESGLNSEKPESVASTDDLWQSASQISTVGIFILLFGACLYVSRPVLLPVSAAVIVGITLAPIVKFAARHRVSPWMTAIALGAVLVVVTATMMTLAAAPLSEWIGKLPEMGVNIRAKLHVLDRPLAALREFYSGVMPSRGSTVAVEPSELGIVTPVITFATPAAIQLTLFFVTLIFFLAAQMDFRRYMVSFFTTREAKLRFLRIANEIEENMASYVATVTVINVLLGVATGIGAWVFGLPNPIIIGMLATVLNFMPYVGASCLTLILLGVSLVTFSSLAYALVPPAAFVVLATVEGQFITPAVLGHRLTLNPLVVLLALAFWAWLWGPVGAFIAVPFTIVAMVILHHLFPPEESKLPG
ncbi:MAG: AI-2E family transporter [Xanthobacteraceae bacterium]